MVKKIFFSLYIIGPFVLIFGMDQNNKKERPLISPYGIECGGMPYSTAYIAARWVGLSLTIEEIKQMDEQDKQEYGPYDESNYYRNQMMYEYKEYKKNKKRLQRKQSKESTLSSQSKILNSFTQELNRFKGDK